MYLTDGPSDSSRVFLFAHGAGGAMDTPFMASVARLLGEQGIRVVRFEFPYMAARRNGGPRRAPDRAPVLVESWRRVIDEHGGGAAVFIGGKSMGGRIATMVADDAGVRGAVCLGYPFHPPGKPEQLRTAHLESLRTPLLIVQGTRDPFGTPADVATYQLSPTIEIEWIEGGDHSLKGAGNLELAVSKARLFMERR
jgi:uncharacterized protein